MNDNTEQLVCMLKVLADENRLEILRLLNEREYSVGDIAEKVNIAETTVSQHLNQMREAWLLSLKMVGTHRLYRANEDGLAMFKSLVADIEKWPCEPLPETNDAWIEDLGWDAADQQVLRDFTRDGKLTTYPDDFDDLAVILKWLATLFEPNRQYTEPEVNAILMDVFERDHVSLRRDLVDMRLLKRDRGGRNYWREVEEKAQS